MMKRLAAALGIWSFFALFAGQARADVPGPLRLNVPFDPAWKGMLDVIKKRGLETEQADRGRGRILTVFREYSSGPMTEGHIAKIGTRPKLIDSEWVRVKYQMDVELQIIEARVTLVTASATIKALKRDFLGQESWVDITSNGELETDLLTDFGKELFGQSFQLPKDKKGFWEREPKYVPDGEEQIPKVVGPERPTP